MFCKSLKATMSINACIRRQKWSKLYTKLKFIYDHSIITCQSCDQGKKTKDNPDYKLDQDFQTLKNNQLKIIRERGWVFKETISLESLYNTFDYTQIKTRRNTNDKEHSILRIGNRERIIRFIRKHRSIARDKQNISKPIRIELNTKSGFQLGFTENRRSRRGDTPYR